MCNAYAKARASLFCFFGYTSTSISSQVMSRAFTFKNVNDSHPNRARTNKNQFNGTTFNLLIKRVGIFCAFVSGQNYNYERHYK
nr:hypothetical protein [Mucilaginibacter sp. X5P1]